MQGLDRIREVYGLLKDGKSYDDIRDYLRRFKDSGKLIICNGRENIVEEGPSMIIANYTGSGRDIIGLIREYDSRRLYGLIPRFMFSEDATLKRAKEAFGPKIYDIIDWAASKTIAPLANIATLTSERLTALEMIPMDMDYDGDIASPHKDIVDIIKDYIKSPTVDVNSGIIMETNRAVVIFQLRRKGIHGQGGELKEVSRYHSYLPRFNNTVATIVDELYQEEVDVPVTPIAFYSIGKWNTPGKWWNPTAKTWMNIGKSVHIKDFIGYNDPIKEFTDYLEYTVAGLLKEIGAPDKHRHAKGAKT